MLVSSSGIIKSQLELIMPRKKCIQTIRDLVSCRSASLAKSCPGDVSTTFMRFPLFKKVFKVSTITIDLLLLLLPFAFWFAFKSQGLISILSVTICLLTIEITLKNASVVTGSAWVLEEKKYGTSRFSITSWQDESSPQRNQRSKALQRLLENF